MSGIRNVGNFFIFFYFCGPFLLSWIRIPSLNADPYPATQINADPDPKPYFFCRSFLPSWLRIRNTAKLSNDFPTISTTIFYNFSARRKSCFYFTSLPKICMTVGYLFFMCIISPIAQEQAFSLLGEPMILQLREFLQSQLPLIHSSNPGKVYTVILDWSLNQNWF